MAQLKPAVAKPGLVILYVANDGKSAPVIEPLRGWTNPGKGKVQLPVTMNGKVLGEDHYSAIFDLYRHDQRNALMSEVDRLVKEFKESV